MWDSPALCRMKEVAALAKFGLDNFGTTIPALVHWTWDIFFEKKESATVYFYCMSPLQLQSMQPFSPTPLNEERRTRVVQS